jgi:hypothetical protein
MESVDLLTVFSISDGEEPERTCVKHLLETWFVGTRAGR